jgi:3-methyladenine DNA glycosylase/8-oxoguanine DNA glycosylase
VNHQRAHQHLAATDPRLAALIAQSLRYNIKPALSIRPFDALAESIAYQQLSGKAAATIFGRVRALVQKKWLDPIKFSRRRTKLFVRLAFRAARPLR